MRKIRNVLAAFGLAASVVAFGPSASALPSAGVNSNRFATNNVQPVQGYGYGPGMMGGYGPGMMGGYGPGMMMGFNGPGMMMGWGWGNQGNLNLSADDVKNNLERWIAWQGNERLKVGEVKVKDDDTITADIVTKDNSLVQRFIVNRHNGFMRPTSG